MTLRRIGLVTGLVIIAGLGSLDTAAARRHHRVRVVTRVAPQFVFGSQPAADTVSFAGKFAGYFQPGILGATTADPYERPGYGYYVGGGRGPGFFYDGQ